jgi:transcriptional regulator with XRE-family HTH domain
VKYAFLSPPPWARQTVDTLEHRFGAVIRRRRVALNLGQEAFADRAGLHRTHVSMIERGLRSPTLAVLHKLAGALSTSMASLLEEAERAGKGTGKGAERTLPPGRRKKGAG